MKLFKFFIFCIFIQNTPQAWAITRTPPVSQQPPQQTMTTCTLSPSIPVAVINSSSGAKPQKPTLIAAHSVNIAVVRYQDGKMHLPVPPAVVAATLADGRQVTPQQISRKSLFLLQWRTLFHCDEGKKFSSDLDALMDSFNKSPEGQAMQLK